MSFILDALKKSESDRQQHGPAEFAGVPTSNGRQRAPRWLWVLGVLLAINLAVLLGILLRPGVAVEPAGSEPARVHDDNFAAQVAKARRNIPPREQPRAATLEPRPVATETVATDTSAPPGPAAPATAARRHATSTAALPTLQEVVASGTVTLPPLHVDIHVFAASPDDRFVFINMNKQVEGSRLAEGPVVEEITTDGVVLSYNGTSFVLPRE